MIDRRTALRLAAAPLLAAPLLAAPRIAGAQGNRVLRHVPLTDVTVLDPVWTTAYITRDHAAMIYDTLFALDADYHPQPQMLAGHTVSEDGLRWTLTLRAGLKFHDGERVLAKDCVASVARWCRRDSFGQALWSATDELVATDDDTMVFRLKRPFPRLAFCLARSGAPYPAMMPERLARTDPYTQVTEVCGSGPFRFRLDERMVGARVVYERFADYRPRESGTPSFTAGPKIVNFDRVEWLVQPDGGTAVNALIAGEVDMVANPPSDLMPLIQRNRNLRIHQLDPLGNLALMRVNHLQPPFNNPGVRRALLSAVRQDQFMLAMMGEDRSLWRDGIGVFAPASPMANEAGMEVLRRPVGVEVAKRALEAAGYRGERAAVLVSTDSPKLMAMGEVACDLMRRIGMNVDQLTMDWGSVIQRRAKKDPVEQGGWSAFFTTFSGADMFDPAGHLALRGTGDRAWFGWPTNARIEELRRAWLRSADETEQKQICEEIQREALQSVPFLPLGQVFYSTATRSNVTDMLRGFNIFWNMRKS